MILGYHVILSVYGFWLPNDPRGSWSNFVWNWELFRFGKPIHIDTNLSTARMEHDHQLRQKAKEFLKFPPVCLSGRQALAVAHGFKRAMAEGNYICYACSILPEHMHLVIERHERPIGRIVGHLKARATQQLRVDKLREGDNRPLWAEGYWKVFLDKPEDVHRAVEYVEENPVKEGKSPQRWSFVMACPG